jgi:ubiquinone/menaquinone biosynthesis C-methylase UbiE
VVTRQSPRPGPGFEQEWQGRFIEFANLRDDDAGIAGWSTTGLRARFRFFQDAWHAVPPGSLYLDIGCGAGTYSRWLAQQGLRVVGIDYSQPTLRKALERTGTGVTYCAADAMMLPFARASVDGAVCLGVLQAIRDSETLVNELARVIRHGGTLWIDALNYHGLAGWWDRTRRKLKNKPLHVRYESASMLTKILLSAGFSHPALTWLPLMPSRLQLIQPVLYSLPLRRLFAGVPAVASVASHSFLIGVQRTAKVR